MEFIPDSPSTTVNVELGADNCRNETLISPNSYNNRKKRPIYDSEHTVPDG